jgi:YegS/Rv2252/BmrU family lipid kinase
MHFFIVNSAAGNGRGKEVWTYIQKTLVYLNIPYEAERTEFVGHARELAAQAVNRSDLKAVVAVGGDGTLHEIANALVGTSLPLGYIPAGTGNDFALAHKIPLDPELALLRVLGHQVRTVDTARIGDETMLGFMGMGFDAQVARLANRSRLKYWLGRLTYPVGALSLLRSFAPADIVLSIDGTTYSYSGVWLIAITNIPNYAGGMKICPAAISDDGELDVCIVRDLTPAQFLRVFPLVYSGRHIHHPSVHLHRGKEIQISSNQPLTAHADGEVLDTPPSSVRIEPGSLLIL